MAGHPGRGGGVTEALPQAPRIGRPLRIALAGAMALMLLAGTIGAMRAVGTDPGRPDIVDFHEVYLAGRLALAGELARAYDPAAMAALQRSLGGRDVFLPFGYPPPLALVLAPLALLPVGVAFLLFGGATLALFLVALRRLAGSWFWPALLATSPAVLIDLKIGQNGLLTAGLAGLGVAAVLDRRRARGGATAGILAAFKPHLAATLPVLFLLRRDGRAMVAAGLACAALWGLALVVFGTASAAAFVGSLGFAGHFMAAGAFPLHRMASVFAAALSLGAPASLALAIHGAGVLAALGSAVALARHLEDTRAAAGLLLMGAAFASPYLYDYDLTVFGAGLALVLPAMARRMTPWRLHALTAAVAAVQSLGLVQNALGGAIPGAGLSLTGPALLMCYGVVAATLARGAPLVTTPVAPSSAEVA